MPELIIITVYNNNKLYENMKETVFETKNNLSVEFIGLDNTQTQVILKSHKNKDVL